jgi:NAD(P)-dependent dehydrogenase (short-subunit alcohol dehydrogenase family)
VSRLPRFEGRVCLVTGGGRGIGRAVARAFAAEGACVGVAARTREQVAEVAREIGGRALGVVTDVTDVVACEAAVATLTERFGRLSVLVNAAGISPVWQRSERHDVDAWRSIVDVNLTGAYLTTRAAAPSLLNGGGAVVMVSSVTSTVGSPRLAAYGASKAALTQLTRTLAREWADRGVRVNAVSPGYVETELTSALLAVERLREDIVARTPLGRIATVDEIVPAVLFLASDEASYVTGVNLLVDGGMAA